MDILNLRIQASQVYRYCLTATTSQAEYTLIDIMHVYCYLVLKTK